MIALQSTGLLYFDSTLEAPVWVHDLVHLRNKALFCEIVANRLLSVDQNRIAHITEPNELLQRLDELK